MFTRRVMTSAVAAAALVASTLTIFTPTGAFAGDRSAAVSAASTTDFSAQRRHYARRGYRGGGGGAAAAAFAGIVGTGLAIAATQNRGDYYGGPGYYGGGPAYYGGGYGGPGYYGSYDDSGPGGYTRVPGYRSW